MLLNALVFPLILKKQATETDYGTFLTKVESGAVRAVEIQEKQIGFIAKDSSGKDHLYITWVMNDPDLVNRLHGAKVKFSKVIPKEQSPLMNFFLTWILPFVLFMGIGQLLIGRVLKNFTGGSNAMTFGKSNAKIYVKAQTLRQTPTPIWKKKVH
jgi:cell division protease FtsH